ncbi:glycosyl transferase [filamentous cyanobacterium CCP5]|nr:glycosyl transferase [filamentous cyanobacterium CCP5]
MLAVFPEADLFSLVDFLPPELRPFIRNKQVSTSFIQRLPFAKKHFRQYLPLMPLAIEQFDLSAYDLVISSNHAVAKGVLTGPDQLHISYVHTPVRYAWELQHQYLQQAGLVSGLKGAMTRSILHYLRLWDLAAANRVDCFVANSRFIARRIWKTYRRPAQVIYPPVAVDRFRYDRPREDFYLVVSRCVPYKRVDMIVAAVNQIWRPLVVVGNGPNLPQIQKTAAANIQLLGAQPDPVVEDLMARCRAFVFAAEEDFGITLVEAQAAGAPVIAYGRGGATETVIEGKTGILFQEQSVASLVDAVKHYECTQAEFCPEVSRNNAENYAVDRFRREFQTYVDQIWEKFQRGEALE